MSRSGYDFECENLNLYRRAVEKAIRGKRGQAFLREMAIAMDAMARKRLIAGELIDAEGEVCAIGAVCKARRVFDTSGIAISDPSSVAQAMGIATALAAEIEYINDDDFRRYAGRENEEQRWQRVRAWIREQIIS
jgi:predicted homoserine dehydrogenase-like protein